MDNEALEKLLVQNMKIKDFIDWNSTFRTEEIALSLQ